MVQESMSTDKNVNNKKDKMFFKASKTIYMCILQDLERSGRTRTHDSMDAEVGTTTHEADPISVEKLVKQFKTHRCARDFDTTFCKATYVNDLT